MYGNNISSTSNFSHVTLTLLKDVFDIKTEVKEKKIMKCERSKVTKRQFWSSIVLNDIYGLISMYLERAWLEFTEKFLAVKFSFQKDDKELVVKVTLYRHWGSVHAVRSTGGVEV
jgi:hypothetical protein